ncbi:MAG: hypothetical protein JNM62_03470 [Flavobacteriales bacterium]|nr:hypothetical protein [Flavobacteriales bacterium]
MPSSIIDTGIAFVERTSADLVEVRFKSGAVLSASGITALLDARERMAGAGPALVLIMFPNEQMDFELAMMTTDNYQGRPAQRHSRAVAWVTRNAHNDRFTRLYFTYFPSPVAAGIFMDEQEARAWLRLQ